MEFVRYDPGKAQPLEGGANVFFVPIRRGDRLAAMLLMLGKKGDTGRREVPGDVMLIVVAGEGRLRSGSEIIDLRAGDVAIMPGRLMHQVWTTDQQLQAVMMTLGAA